MDIAFALCGMALTSEAASSLIRSPPCRCKLWTALRLVQLLKVLLRVLGCSQTVVLRNVDSSCLERTVDVGSNFRLERDDAADAMSLCTTA